MKSKFLVVFLCISVLLGIGLYPLLAQQVNPLGGYSQSGQIPTPYGGIQSYGSSPQAPQGQGYSPQGTTRSPGLQGQPADLSDVSRRTCGWVGLPQQPSPSPRPGIPNSPQTTPVQGLWPGTPGVAGVQEIGTIPPGSPAQQAQIGARQRQGDQGGPQGQTFQGPGQSFPGSRQFLPSSGQVFYEPVSTIEAAYQQVPILTSESRNELRQYGYSLFASPVSTFAPVEDVPVGPDYILGPGDDVTINVWGAMESGLMRTVDRNGQIILPSAGPVRVWGLSFSQAERLIREQLGRYYRGFQTSVTMGRLRTIRVYVVGEVCQPGSFTLSSLSTVTNALFSAGGPLKLGSLRDIQIKRNHHTVGTLDLYDFLLRGDKTRDFRLESGDTIFIPPVGPIAAIAGEVKRPAIYELKGQTRVSDLIEMAGGLMPQSYLKRVQVIRNKPNAEREVIDLDLAHLGQGLNGDSPKNIELRNGDLVKIHTTDPRIYNTLSLAGVVKHPGEYEIKRNMLLSQLLPQGSVLPEASLDGIEIIRFKEDFTTEVIHADLKKAWAGDQAQDIALRPRDQITVRTEFQGHKSIAIVGEVRLPGTYTIKSGEHLSSVIKRAGGFTEKGFLKGAVFIRRSVQEVERKRLEEFMRQQEDRLLAERSSFMAGLQSISTQTTASGLTMADYNYAQKREQLKEVASRVTMGRIVLRLEEPEKLTGTPNDILLEDGDTLTIPQKPAVVLVMGNVRHPTAIIHKDGEDMQYYLNRAGGFGEAADQKGTYLLKADGSALTGFLRLRDVEPGDAIVVPPASQDRYDWSWLKDLATLATQTFLSVAALAAIF